MHLISRSCLKIMTMEYCIRTMNKCNTLPEYEVFDYGQLSNLAFFKKEGIITQPIYIQFVPGVMGGFPMREMLTPTGAIAGMGLDSTCALITDGRFSGVSRGASIGHISPEAAAGGLLAYVRDGDQIAIDIPNHSIQLLVSEEEIAKRKAETVPQPPKQVSGYLKRYRTMRFWH